MRSRKHPDPYIAARARALRQRQTEAEKRLWQELRGRQFEGFKFRRQYPIGNYVADFCCYELRLVVEVDGGQHAGGHSAYERRRFGGIRARGFRILRFWNNDVLARTDEVLASIYVALDRLRDRSRGTPSP